MTDKRKKSISCESGRFTISGTAGVLQIQSTEILKTPRAKKQISALKKIGVAR